MRLSDKELKLYFKQKTDVFGDKIKIQETIIKARKAYYKAETESPLTRFDFLYHQSKYIRKSWWIVQGLLLLALWLLLKYSVSDYYMIRSIGVAAPLFAILVIPEIWKNKSLNAMEIECTTYYSLRQVYAARFILFVLVDLILLSLFLFAASFTVKLAIGELIIQFFVPFNVTCCICFQMLYSKKAMSEAFVLLLCMIWIVVWVQIVLSEAIYRLVSVPAWLAMLLISVLYLGYIIRKGQKQCLEMWEVKALWD